jgi:hypothetical protein
MQLNKSDIARKATAEGADASSSGWLRSEGVLIRRYTSAADLKDGCLMSSGKTVKLQVFSA